MKIVMDLEEIKALKELAPEKVTEYMQDIVNRIEQGGKVSHGPRPDLTHQYLCNNEFKSIAARENMRAAIDRLAEWVKETYETDEITSDQVHEYLLRLERGKRFSRHTINQHRTYFIKAGLLKNFRPEK